MSTPRTFLLWCLPFVLCWPLALLRAILCLPATLLGSPGRL